jgi:hypothetical protein
MSDKELLIQLYEAILTHQAQVRDLKVQIESLKRMMFEHRPQFVPVFELIVGSVSESEAIQQLDAYSRQLQEALQQLRS